MSLPKYGVTVQAHVEQLLTDAAATLSVALHVIQASRRMRAAERQTMSRELAGVVGTCETVRIWLDKGAPK